MVRQMLRLLNPDGSFEPYTVADAISAGFPVLRGSLLELAELNPTGAASIAKACLYVATENQRHLMTADGEALHELNSSGADVPTAWVEGLEALVREVYDLAAAPKDARPSDASISAGMERREQAARQAWIYQGKIVQGPVHVPAPVVRRSPGEQGRRGRRGAAHARSAGSTGRGDPSRPPSALRRLLGALLRLGAGR